MKKSLYAALLLSVFALPAKADVKLPSPVIAVVEQVSLDKSEASKSIISQLEAKRNEVQKELSSYEKELKAQEEKLMSEQKTLSKEEFEKKRQAFEKRVRDVQEKVALRRGQIELAFEDSKKKVLEAFLKVSNEVMKEVGANLVMYKETIITADSAFDVTNKVLEKLNKTLPKVQVTFKPESEVKKLLLQQAPQL